LRETDLYDPLHDYLVSRGYTVRAEVNHCDIAARRGDDLVLIEIKRQLSVDLLVQAARRQRVCDSVYVAVPKPGDTRQERRLRSAMAVLRQLELGLILVSLDRTAPQVEVVFHPIPYQRHRSSRVRRAVIEEMTGRSADYNQGGSSRTKLVTAYRESAIYIACCLEKYGPLSPRQLRALGTGPKTMSILSKDFYGWFQRVERGVYAITARGKGELEAYAGVVAHYRRGLGERPGPP
jgi:hypothetical protein